MRFLVALLWLLALPAWAQGWVKDRTDLPHDADYHLGVLPNGMRWMILPNAQPPGQVAMRLVIDAGSMQERPGEEGAAHFLEHMAFRGTKRYPDGEIQRWLGDLGVRPGPDLNATTAPDETIFKVDMPRNDAVSVFAALSVLRDMASELVFDPALLATERNVVLAEERSRADPALESAKAQMKARLGDHPYSRPPIGTREAVQGMSVDVLRRFYDAYYRPERATLVIVGDVKPNEVIPTMEGVFKDWRGRGQAGADPAPVMQRPAGGRVQVFAIPGMTTSRLEVEWFEPYRASPSNLAERRRIMIDQIVTGAMNQRVQQFMEEEGRPAMVATAPGRSRIPGVWNGDFAGASSVADPGKTLELILRTQRQAAAFGITQAELDRTRQIRKQQAERQATAGRGASSMRADMEAQQLQSDPAYVSRADTLRITSELLDAITLEDVNRALAARFQGEPRVYYYAAGEPAGGAAALEAALGRALKAETAAYAMADVKAWPYTDFGPAGRVVERREVADLGVTFVRFENGVKLAVKQTTFEKGHATVRMTFGLGQLGMPRDGITASDVSSQLWSNGGLGKLTRREQQLALAGKNVVTFMQGSRDDRFVMDGFPATGDLGLQLQVMAAMMTDPGWRADEWATWMRLSDDADAAMPFSAGGVLGFNLTPLMHGGDLRWTFNTKAQRDTWTPDQTRAFMAPIVANSPIELVVVGDVKVDDVIAEASRTLGALPPRAAAPEPAGLRDVKIAQPGKTLVFTHKGRKDQGIISVVWPTEQGLYANIREHRAGIVLGMLLQDRATLHFRTDEGATYSPGVHTDFSRSLPQWGAIQFGLELPPEKIDAAFAKVDELARELATVEVGEDELRRVTGPRVEASRQDRNGSNSYWAGNLVGAFDDPRPLDVIRTQERDYATITAAEVKAAAVKWLRGEKALRVKVVPE